MTKTTPLENQVRFQGQVILVCLTLIFIEFCAIATIWPHTNNIIGAYEKYDEYTGIQADGGCYAPAPSNTPERLICHLYTPGHEQESIDRWKSQHGYK